MERRAAWGLLAAALAVAGCGRRGDPLPPGLRLPAAPREVTLGAPAGALTVAWAAPREDLNGRPLEEVAGYLVLRSAWAPGTDACAACPGEAETVAAIDAVAARARGENPTRWTDPSPRPGWTYRYAVRALDPHGRPGPTSRDAQIAWVPLAPPHGAAVEGGDGEALLRVAPATWPEGLLPLGLRVYGADGRRVAEEAASPIRVLGLANGVEARLDGRWAARTPEGWEVESRPLPWSVRPADGVAPLPPGDLVALADPRGVLLRWMPSGAEPYAEVVLWRGEGAFAPAVLARLPGDALAYLDQEVGPGRTYRYAAVAVDAAGNESLPCREAVIAVHPARPPLVAP